MILLLDMDGPVADFDGLLFDRCAENGWPMDVAGPLEQTARYATDHIIDPEHRKAMRAMCDGPGWFRDLPVVEGALDGMHMLEGVGFDVWICTKPLRASDTCASEKVKWVETHLGESWVSRLIIAPDKSMIRGHVLLDDAPYLEWLPQAEWRSVIFPASWNGVGSLWEGIARWGWGDDPRLLIEHASTSPRAGLERV